MVMVRMKVLPSLTFLLVLQEVCDCADQCIFCHLEVEPLNEEEQEEKEQLLEEVLDILKSFDLDLVPPHNFLTSAVQFRAFQHGRGGTSTHSFELVRNMVVTT